MKLAGVHSTQTSMTAFAVPPFATIRSVINAWCLESPQACPSFADDMLRLPRGDRNLFAWSAQRLSDEFFLGAIAADSLLDQHSQLPLFCAMLPADHAAKIREGQRSGTDLAYHALNQFAQRDLLESGGLRRCPVCVHEDMHRYGVAHWRLFHQWPFARHCAEHRAPLEERCKQCNSSQPLLPLLRQMATDPCAFCGRRCNGFTRLVEQKPVQGETQPYWSLLDLAYRALKGEAPELRPEIITNRLQDLQSRGLTQPVLLALTLRHWKSTSLAELAESLDVVVDPAAYKCSEGYVPLMSRLALLSCVLDTHRRAPHLDRTARHPVFEGN